jgi:WhiB family transcriptional regulator, redox-sensing transcriptional regulator
VSAPDWHGNRAWIVCHVRGCERVARTEACGLCETHYRRSLRGTLELVDPPMPDASWAQHAACRGMDPALFFPERGESTAEAKACCATCPVRVECLEYALEADEKFGIFGGASERQRRRMRRQRREGVA